MRNNIGMRAVLLAAAMLLGACSAAEFWNGEYAESAALRSSRNKEAAFYAAESPQAKATRAQTGMLPTIGVCANGVRRCGLMIGADSFLCQKGYLKTGSRVSAQLEFFR